MRKHLLAVLTAGAAALALVFASGSSAAGSARSVEVLDDCDAATFNAVLGTGACVKDGDTTFAEFISQLLTQGRAPAWRFAPGQLTLAAGGTVEARNRGGEFHTFTEVANFGGGCVAPLNALLGLTPVPECATPGIFGATGVVPGGSRTTAPLGPGIHRFECLIHPWMRTTIDVG